jgi:hypothetical protein
MSTTEESVDGAWSEEEVWSASGVPSVGRFAFASKSKKGESPRRDMLGDFEVDGMWLSKMPRRWACADRDVEAPCVG